MNELDFGQLLSEENLRAVVWPWLLESGAKALRFVAILGLASVLSPILGRLLQRAVSEVLERSNDEDALAAAEYDKRTATLASVIRRTVVVAVWATAAVMALSEVGFNIGPLIAGAGVAGLAIGFGAQNLVRDFFSGFFILVENQIRVGDVAVINGTGGLVEQINLRTTVLRDLEGTVHVFPNGAITELANKTIGFSFHVFDVGVAYKEDSDRVIELIRDTVASMREDGEVAEMILDDAEVFGLDRFGESAVVIKGRIRSVPGKQWAVGREFNRRLKQRFDEEGIEIPFPHRKLIMDRPVGDDDGATPRSG